MSSKDKKPPEQEYVPATKEVKNSCLITTDKVIPSIVGDIKEWKCCPENLPAHPTMAFFGKRRTGKSTTITNIAYHCCQKIPFGLVMSDTAYAGTTT